MRILKRAVLVCAVVFILLALVLGASVLLSDDVAWRFTVVKAKLSGKIPEIPLPLLLKWLRPDSPMNLRRLAVVPNVNSGVLLNPYGDASLAVAGAKYYRQTCAECHGGNARGRTGPDLLAAVGRMTDWTFFSTVKWGRPRTIMMPQPLSDLEICQVGAFLRQSAVDSSLGQKSSVEGFNSFPSVSKEMLLSAG